MQSNGIPTHKSALLSVDEIIPIGPTSPQVPIPALTPAHLSLNTIVERGPQIVKRKISEPKQRRIVWKIKSN